MNLENTVNNSDKVQVHISVFGEQSAPPHPGAEWTRFVLVSDTHSRTQYRVPEGDVLIHAGDLSSHGAFTQLEVYWHVS
jgi:hypothetical protein